MRLRLMLAASVFAAALMAACGGGGGGGSTSAPAPAATAEPSDPIQLFLVPASEASGSPITEPSPGTFGVNNLSIPFTAVGQTQGVLVYEPGFTGTFAANVKNCTLVPNAVTVTPNSYTGVKQGVFVITATSAGYCEVTVQDGTNGATVLVDVTTTTGTISSIQRH